MEISKVSGKADGRREEMIRVFGNFNDMAAMKTKLENARKLIKEEREANP